MGLKKDRNGMDLTEGEDIKKRWQEYTEELYKKELHDPDNHDGVITHLEPNILECEVKWALESILAIISGFEITVILSRTKMSSILLMTESCEMMVKTIRSVTYQ